MSEHIKAFEHARFWSGSGGSDSLTDRNSVHTQKPYTVMEHFIPISLGGGTTAFNCVPACARCKARKRDKHPAEIADTELQPAIRALQRYLNERRERWINEEK